MSSRARASIDRKYESQTSRKPLGRDGPDVRPSQGFMLIAEVDAVSESRLAEAVHAEQLTQIRRGIDPTAGRDVSAEASKPLRADGRGDRVLLVLRQLEELQGQLVHRAQKGEVNTVAGDDEET